MTLSTLAHLFGAFLLTSALPAQLRSRAVLSRILLLVGMAVAHLPELLATSMTR